MMDQGMKINILLPFFLEHPGGGIKVMYQYANLLKERGHDVAIYHIRKLRKKSLRSWCAYILQRFFHKMYKYPTWFPLDPSIPSIQIAWASNQLIRDADILFSTWWVTASEMMKLSNSKGEKFNLLQEHADPLRSFEVEQAYRFPIHYLTISKQLQKTVFQYANKIVPIIPNGLDRKEFFLAVPIELREPLSIIMLYSEDPGKGTMYGLQALEQVVNKYPDLRVTLFGIYTQPQDLPAYCSYHQSPNNLAALYNQSAIFITPSLQEGWGLVAMEAMACGCACVCTRIDGHMEFMDKDTAILVNSRNSIELASGIIKLIEEPNLRYQLVSRGIDRVARFSLEDSANKLERIFLSKVDEANR